MLTTVLQLGDATGKSDAKMSWANVGRTLLLNNQVFLEGFPLDVVFREPAPYGIERMEALLLLLRDGTLRFIKMTADEYQELYDKHLWKIRDVRLEVGLQEGDSTTAPPPDTPDDNEVDTPPSLILNHAANIGLPSTPRAFTGESTTQPPTPLMAPIHLLAATPLPATTSAVGTPFRSSAKRPRPEQEDLLDGTDSSMADLFSAGEASWDDAEYDGRKRRRVEPVETQNLTDSAPSAALISPSSSSYTVPSLCYPLESLPVALSDSENVPLLNQGMMPGSPPTVHGPLHFNPSNADGGPLNFNNIDAAWTSGVPSGAL
jgi:hypothetical protein